MHEDEKVWGRYSVNIFDEIILDDWLQQPSMRSKFRIVDQL
jgi:hypothetical protein